MQHDYKIQLFFSPLQTKVSEPRKQFLDELEKLFNSEDDYCNYSLGYNSGFNVENNNVHIDRDKYLPVLLRLSLECPFQDVRESSSRILKKLESQGVRIPRCKYNGPSKFISQTDCVPTNTNDEKIKNLFIDAYIVTGRISHVKQLLAYHTDYLTCFFQFETHLMNYDGPLPLDWRYFIGIMGASRHQCSLLIEGCEQMFLINHGDPNWLNGLSNVPQKLKNLNKLNVILAHQPWLINENVMEILLNNQVSEDNWSKSELAQAIVILVHFQTLSGFVYGCGVAPEIDMHNGSTLRSMSVSETSSGTETITPTKLKANSFTYDGGSTAALLQKIQSVIDEQISSSQSEEDEQLEKLRQFKEVETKEFDEETYDVVKESSNSFHKRYCDDSTYQEFAKRDKSIEVFRAHDYSWDEHGFSFINRLYPEFGDLLDKKFSCAHNLTYRTMGDHITNVDTSKFRLATWNYIHLLFGIFHDDYVYNEVNTLLEKSYKTYIKKVACFPEQITFLDYWECYTDMLASEKIHINLLVMESRMQAVLLYAFRYLTTYMK
ncbi:sestrin-1 isoform X2 [Hydra vulgaris]|uniref:Sestrin-1 isoform X2 n=1 Tax=Hydra vulgaris TaxID=6087 RepID=A0ABM4BLX6_HYDVU